MPNWEGTNTEAEHYRCLLNTLFAVMSEHESRCVVEIANDIIAEHAIDGHISHVKLMVAYGGGKDSTYTVAFMRAVQLQVAQTLGNTYVLRVATMRHAGVPYAVMQNIHTIYDKLGLLDDPHAELILVDNHDISPFDRDTPLPAALIEINRNDILMNGHRSRGDGRPTFCNSCNLSVANFYGLACWWNEGVDIIVTGDSRKEQKQYYTWIMRMGQTLGINTTPHQDRGIQGLLSVLSQVGETYYRDLYGDNDIELAKRYVSEGGTHKAPDFLNLYEKVGYRIDEHWKLVVDHLGFRFDDLAFSFTESDCFNPAFMAHIRGLHARHIQHRSYADGIREYLELAERLMKKKEMPKNLILLALSRYDTDSKIDAMRTKVSHHVKEVFGMCDTHLVTLLHSPFVDRGKNLETFLREEHTGMLDHVASIRQVLRTQAVDHEPVVPFLKRISGLSIQSIRQLHSSNSVDFTDGTSIISIVRRNDPHKSLIQTTDPTTGKPIQALVSGR